MSSDIFFKDLQTIQTVMEQSQNYKLLGDWRGRKVVWTMKLLYR